MKYRRPQDFDTAERLLRSVTTFHVQGKQKQLQDAVVRLFDLGWFEHAMRPLYNANAACQLVMNSLVPIIQELILEERVFEEHERACDAAKAVRYGEEFDRMRAEMIRVAPLRRDREVTPEFEAMAAAMERYAHDDLVQLALRDVFCLMKTARVAFRLVFGRINHALAHHCEIVKSDDIPLEALSL